MNESSLPSTQEREAALLALALAKPVAERAALVRLKAHLNSEVKVLDLASTLGPVAERNCIRAITLGGEQREAKDQSVT